MSQKIGTQIRLFIASVCEAKNLNNRRLRVRFKFKGPGSDLDKDEFCDDCLLLCLSTITTQWLPSNRQSVYMCYAESRVSSGIALSLCSFSVSSNRYLRLSHTKALPNITFMWPCCIVTNFFVIKPTRCTNFTNLFWHETLHVSGSSSVHHQELIHCTLSNGICHIGLLTYIIAECTVNKLLMMDRGTVRNQ